MPENVRPGTPSIGFGSRIPCQWIEVGSERRLVTLSVTVSPSRQRRTGAGTCPLTAIAVRGWPVMLNGSLSIARLKDVPVRTLAGLVAAARLRSGQGAAAIIPAPAIPWTKRRRLRDGIIVRPPP